MTDRVKFSSLLTKLCIGAGRVKTIQLVVLSTFVRQGSFYLFPLARLVGWLVLLYHGHTLIKGQQSTIIENCGLIININCRAWGLIITSLQSGFGLTRSWKKTWEYIYPRRLFHISDYDRKTLKSLSIFLSWHAKRLIIQARLVTFLKFVVVNWPWRCREGGEIQEEG